MKTKKAFTLVELIVVITILAILWTIAFISLQWYSRDARDTTRKSDVWSIETSLTLFETQRWFYPEPTLWVDITFSWSQVWNQWSVWDSVIDNLSQLNKKPVDPLTLTEYAYSRLNTKKEFEVWATLEWWLTYNKSPLTQVSAAWTKLWTAYIRWDYNWIVAKVNTWSTTYVLWVPTIISWDISLTDIIQLQQNNKLSFHWTNNLPATYRDTEFNADWWWFVFNPASIVAYEWTTQSLEILSNQSTLIDNIQTIYWWTDLENLSDEIKKIINSTWDDEKLLASIIVKNNLNSKVEIYDTPLEVTFTCWDTVSAWWETYTTILWPDGNCWTSQNMRHGTMLANWSTMPSNDTTIQKWCYDNNTTNCTNEWWLYTWNEAMWYWTTDNEDTAKSVCGQLWAWWNLPTDAQWTSLISAWATWWTWNKLSGIVSSLPGSRVALSSFLYRGTGGNWWSSTENDSSNSLNRHLESGNGIVYSDYDGKFFGFSVVCIKN